MGVDPVTAGIMAGGQILGGIGGKNQANQQAALQQANLERAARAIYQPQFTGQIDPMLYSRLQAPAPGVAEVQNVLAGLQTPGSAQNNAIVEAVRSLQAPHGLGESPLGAVFESAQIIPMISQQTMSAANLLAQLEAQRTGELQSYMGAGIGAGSNLASALTGGATQYGQNAQLLGPAAGTILNQGMTNFPWSNIFNPNAAAAPASSPAFNPTTFVPSYRPGGIYQ